MIDRLIRALLIALLALTLTVPSAWAGVGTQLFQGGRNAAYSRVIKLANGTLLAAHIVEYADNSGEIRIYKSTNNGVSFTFVTAFTDGTGYQIGTPDLIEVAPGTVLMAYNRWNDTNFGAGEWLKIARTTNEGAAWSIIATVETPPVWNWEPEFGRSSDGKLQLYYSYASSASDTLDATGKQTIARRESADNGVTWSARSIALGTVNGDNFGMARVTKCGNTYYMVAERYDDGAAVTLTTSSDGKTWAGSSSWKQVEKVNDGWMFSTPEIVCANGALYALGLVYNNWFFGDDENNGLVMLKSTNGGASWTEVPITVQYDPNTDEANYSPTLLPLNSTTMFMITNSNTNTIRFGTAAIP
jgi:hypothetical protein